MVRSTREIAVFAREFVESLGPTGSAAVERGFAGSRPRMKPTAPLTGLGRSIRLAPDRGAGRAMGMAKAESFARERGRPDEPDPGNAGGGKTSESTKTMSSLCSGAITPRCPRADARDRAQSDHDAQWRRTKRAGTALRHQRPVG